MVRHIPVFVFALVGLVLVACAGAQEIQEPRPGVQPEGQSQSGGAPPATEAASLAQPTSKAPYSEVTSPPGAETGNQLNDLAHPFTLPSVEGTSFSLEAQRGDKNIVIVFYRAYW